MPARPRLGDLPALRLLDAMATPAARAAITGVSFAALVIRDRMLEVGVACVSTAGREGTAAIANLDQVAKGAAGLVAARCEAVIALVSWDGLQAHGACQPTGHAQRPRPAPVRVAGHPWSASRVPCVTGIRGDRPAGQARRAGWSRRTGQQRRQAGAGNGKANSAGKGHQGRRGLAGRNEDPASGGIPVVAANAAVL